MKIPVVFLTSFFVLITLMSLVGAHSSAYAQVERYVLSNNQSVTSLMPLTNKKWNLVYQLNPTTPVTSAIQYQPELHTFVAENVLVQADTLALAVKQPSASPSATIATPSATLITIDKSESEVATKTAQQKPAITPKPTAIPNPVALPASELDALFEKYAGEYGLSAGVLKRIAACESGLRPEALSSNGLYGGLFQFVSSTWSGNRKAMGLDPDPQLRFNAEEAIKTAAFKISRDGYGAWPVCGKKAVAAVI